MQDSWLLLLCYCPENTKESQKIFYFLDNQHKRDPGLNLHSADLVNVILMKKLELVKILLKNAKIQISDDFQTLCSRSEFKKKLIWSQISSFDFYH